jgi:hypothetical protein
MKNSTDIERRLIQILSILAPITLIALIALFATSYLTTSKGSGAVPTSTPQTPSSQNNSDRAANPANNTGSPRTAPPVTQDNLATPTVQSAISQVELDQKLKANFKILYGQPAIAGNFVTAASANGVTLQIGGPNLTNYSASFDIQKTSREWQMILSSGNQVEGYFSPNGITWYNEKEGKTIPNSAIDHAMPGASTESVTLDVNGTNLNVTLNGQTVSKINTGGPISGPLSVFLAGGVGLGNFKLTNH